MRDAGSRLAFRPSRVCYHTCVYQFGYVSQGTARLLYHGDKMKPMPRRKRRKPLAGISLGGLTIAVCCLFVISLLLKNPSILIFLFVLLAVGAVAFFLLTVFLPARERDRIIEKANAMVDQNAENLARRRTQLVRQDAYGKPVLDKWAEEIEYFIDRHVKPSLTSSEQSVLRKYQRAITGAVAQHIEQVTNGKPVFEALSDSMTPTEFEVFCAEQLRQAGWNASVTRRSRDQGVDVVAEKDGLRLVLQCKLYSNPVGNKAVQEAVAAKGFEQAHYCAVVSNTRYTSAAEQLASTNKVLLLHYSDLKNIENILRDTKCTS